jgi:hypothetical protein
MNEDYIFEEEVEVHNSTSYTPEEPPKQSIGMAVTALVLGIISLMFFLSFINVITGISAIILACIFLASHNGKRGRGLAWIGLCSSVVSIVALIMSISMIYSNIDHIAPLYDDLMKMYGLEADYNYEMQIDVDDTF